MLLVIYCVLIAGASYLGGWLPTLLRLTHTRLQLAMSFVGGAMLGVGVLHLAPHAASELGSVDHVMTWLLVGFVAMFFIERVFHFHHHDAVADETDAPSHVHGPNCDHKHDHGPTTPPTGWAGALTGLALHSALDGLALAASVVAEQREGHWLAGLGVFLAVVLHKPFDALTLSTLMTVSGQSLARRRAVNLAYALAVPIGAGLFVGGARELGLGAEFVGVALALAAGIFLCISTSDLLPELQFHAHDRLKLSAALLLGLALAWAIGFLEPGGHDHSHAPEHAHAHHAGE